MGGCKALNIRSFHTISPRKLRKLLGVRNFQSTSPKKLPVETFTVIAGGAIVKTKYVLFGLKILISAAGFFTYCRYFNDTDIIQLFERQLYQRNLRDALRYANEVISNVHILCAEMLAIVHNMVDTHPSNAEDIDFIMESISSYKDIMEKGYSFFIDIVDAAPNEELENLGRLRTHLILERLDNAIMRLELLEDISSRYMSGTPIPQDMLERFISMGEWLNVVI